MKGARLKRPSSSRLRCAVHNCCGGTGDCIQDGRRVVVYAFPSVVEGKIQEKVWSRFVGVSKGDPSWVPDRDIDGVCSLHFTRGVRSVDPRKSNYAPSLRYVNGGVVFGQQHVIYDVGDFVGWWVNEGDGSYPDLNPVLETKEKDAGSDGNSDVRQQLRSFSLVEVDVKAVPPIIVRCLKVDEGLGFNAFFKSKKVVASAILGEECTRVESSVLGNLFEFKEAVRRLVALRDCQGVGVFGLRKGGICGEIRRMREGQVVRERAFSGDCDGVVAGSICPKCQKMFKAGFANKRDAERGDEECEEGNKVARLEESVRLFEGEVKRLKGQNSALRRKLRGRGSLGLEGGGPS